MARRARKDDELGPAVPRWVAEYDPAKHQDMGSWVVAVWDWVDAQLSHEHLGAAYDLKERSFKAWMGGAGGA